MAEELKVSSESSAPAQPVLALAQPEQKKKQESDFPFAVSVSAVYEEPLDLLLDLIRKQDIDIYDIPIARITAQYLAYVEKLRELDVNVAAEFIYMAAVLIHIKSKMIRAPSWSTACSSTRSSNPQPKCSCKSSKLKTRCATTPQLKNSWMLRGPIQRSPLTSSTWSRHFSRFSSAPAQPQTNFA